MSIYMEYQYIRNINVNGISMYRGKLMNMKYQIMYME